MSEGKRSFVLYVVFFVIIIFTQFFFVDILGISVKNFILFVVIPLGVVFAVAGIKMELSQSNTSLPPDGMADRYRDNPDELDYYGENGSPECSNGQFRTVRFQCQICGNVNEYQDEGFEMCGDFRCQYCRNIITVPKHRDNPPVYKNRNASEARLSSTSFHVNNNRRSNTQIIKTNKTNSKKSQTVYLLDGSNIIHWEKETHGVSLDVLCSIIDYLKSAGEDYYVLFDASAPHVLRENNRVELERFKSLLSNDPFRVRMIPAGTRADEDLLEEARRDPKAVILTNDQYRDHVKMYPDVLNDRERRIQHGMIMKGDKDILFRGINLSIPIKRS